MPSRKKLKALWIGALLMIFVCYSFSFSKTIQQYKIYRQSKNILSDGNEGYDILSLEQKNRVLNEVVDQYILDTADNSKNLLSIVARLCNENEVILKEYKPTTFTVPDSIRLLTRSLVLEGTFKNCLKLVYSLETQSKIGHVSSLLFKSYTNPTETKTTLNCTVYVQNILPPLHEK